MKFLLDAILTPGVRPEVLGTSRKNSFEMIKLCSVQEMMRVCARLTSHESHVVAGSAKLVQIKMAKMAPVDSIAHYRVREIQRQRQ